MQINVSYSILVFAAVPVFYLTNKSTFTSQNLCDLTCKLEVPIVRPAFTLTTLYLAECGLNI